MHKKLLQSGVAEQWRQLGAGDQNIMLPWSANEDYKPDLGKVRYGEAANSWFSGNSCASIRASAWSQRLKTHNSPIVRPRALRGVEYVGHGAAHPVREDQRWGEYRLRREP